VKYSTIRTRSGFVWEIVCGYLGFSTYDASKLMGLAAYGNLPGFRRAFQSIMPVGKEDYAVDRRRSASIGQSSRIETLLGPPRTRPWKILPRHADMRRRYRSHECAVMALVRRLKRQVPLDNLCFAGGVALNCVTNELSGNRANSPMCSYPPRRTMAGTAVGASPCRALRQAEK
jgi:carbamoyltransferase